MMQAFRSSAKIVAVVFAVLMLLFLVDLSGITGGAAGGGLFTQTTVGKVNGKRIEARSYETAVQQQVEARQRQVPGALSLEDLQQIRDGVWEQFIQSTVLEQEYKNRGIEATEDEILDVLRNAPPQEFANVPEFQTDGRFDLAKYQRWLSSSVAQPYIPALEEQAREQVLRGKLLRVVTSDIFVSDAALWERYRDKTEKVKIGLTPILPRMAVPDSAVTVTPAEVEQYYRAHQEELKRPETAFLSYVVVPRVPNAADTAAALERIRAAREEITKGAPFAEVAKRESDDSVSGANGGELGSWKRGQFDATFDSVAFSLPLKTLSEPVLTQFGYHLIEVTSRKADSATGRHILATIQVSGDHRDQLDAQADTLEQLAAERLDGAALDSAARALRLVVGRGVQVSEGSRVQIGRAVVPDAGIWAFQAKKGEISPIIESSQAMYLFRLDSVRTAGVPPLAQIRGDVEFLARQDKKTAAAKEIAGKFLARVRGGTAMETAANEIGLLYREVGPFTRTEPPLPNAKLVGTAFALKTGQISDVVETDEGLYVLKVLEHTPADSAAFRKDIDQLRADAIRLARQDRVQSYLASLRKSAEVVDRREGLFRTSAQAAAQSGT